MPRVDILVNCAGIISVGPLSERGWPELSREITLNAVVVARLCHHYGAAMIAAGQGRILNFASTAAARPAPLHAPYAASKAFVLHLSQSLAAEWRTSGVRVTCCVPGPVATSFAARGGLANRRDGSDPAKSPAPHSLPPTEGTCCAFPMPARGCAMPPSRSRRLKSWQASPARAIDGQSDDAGRFPRPAFFGGSRGGSGGLAARPGSSGSGVAGVGMSRQLLQSLLLLTATRTLLRRSFGAPKCCSKALHLRRRR